MSLNVSKKVFKRRLQKFKRTPDNKRPRLKKKNEFGIPTIISSRVYMRMLFNLMLTSAVHKNSLVRNVNEIAVDASASIKSAVLTDTVFDTLKGKISEATLKSVRKNGI